MTDIITQETQRRCCSATWISSFYWPLPQGTPSGNPSSLTPSSVQRKWARVPVLDCRSRPGLGDDLFAPVDSHMSGILISLARCPLISSIMTPTQRTHLGELVLGLSNVGGGALTIMPVQVQRCWGGSHEDSIPHYPTSFSGIENAHIDAPSDRVVQAVLT
jgi:hypothetical protein